MENRQEIPEWKKHHPWCNNFLKPREGCKMCEDFYIRFPIEENASRDVVSKLAEEYFPDVVFKNK
jgi:hypothetical protein